MNYSRGEIVLLPYPFSDLTRQKVRPAVVVSVNSDPYGDIFIVPLTSKTEYLSEGEFVLEHWEQGGLNIPSAIKRGCFLIDESFVAKKIGAMSDRDLQNLNRALRLWLGL